VSERKGERVLKREGERDGKEERGIERRRKSSHAKNRVFKFSLCFSFSFTSSCLSIAH